MATYKATTYVWNGAKRKMVDVHHDVETTGAVEFDKVASIDCLAKYPIDASSSEIAKDVEHPSEGTVALKNGSMRCILNRHHYIVGPEPIYSTFIVPVDDGPYMMKIPGIKRLSIDHEPGDTCRNPDTRYGSMSIGGKWYKTRRTSYDATHPANYAMDTMPSTAEFGEWAKRYMSCTFDARAMSLRCACPAGH